ncbi:hypothetical protein N7467_001299 [Penicillium canescens]|nr:hypothetical protein N7467_001299 [Penicillium canescens]
MADGLQMGNLSLNESQHAPAGNAPGAGRAAYIPPHLRQRGPGPAPANVDPAAAPRRRLWWPSVHGPPGGKWANANAPDFSPRGPANGKSPNMPNPIGQLQAFDPQAYGHPGSSYGGGNYSGGGAQQGRGSGDGQWRDGKHIPGPANARVERELFGVPNDPSKQQTGINFANYDDIPVEASGNDVPEPVTQFTNPPSGRPPDLQH